MTTTDPGGAKPGRRLPGFVGLLVCALVLAGCDANGSGSSLDPRVPDENPVDQCSLDTDFLADGGVGRDGIPSIQDPTFVDSNHPTLDYLRPEDRVIGLVVDGQAYAVPHNILWWHEIVNMDVGGEKLAVTFCPLTGSSLAFDRSSVGGDEFGVSGLLFQNNLVMFNRGDPEGLFPQMLSEARCGQARGQTLEQWPVMEMTWAGWHLIHPATKVISGDTGFDRNYRQYPYGDYESLESTTFLLSEAMPPLDRRRPVKERVVGVPPVGDDPGIAFPFGELEELEGQVSVVRFTYDGEPAVLLWADEMRGGMAYRPRTRAGQPVTLEARSRSFFDRETGTKWSVDGRATFGELGGARLEPLERTYVAFWGAWAAFHEETRLWKAGTQPVGGDRCTLDPEFLVDGGADRGGIPAIDDPTFVTTENLAAVDYLRPSDRVVGTVVDGTAYAVPLNILWWHEIVNMEVGGEELAVTLCPLTGSSLVFDRSSVGGDELGVSGLLFKNNLIMFNRGEPEGLFPQMISEARCGEARGRELARWPAVEMTWAGWQFLHPATRVMSAETGFDRNYRENPYGRYQSLESDGFLLPEGMPELDRRRPVKERVVGVPPTAGDPGIAFPFGALREEAGEVAVVEFTYDGTPAILLWADGKEGGMAFRPQTRSGRPVTLEAVGRTIVDRETGSEWGISGTARSGELAGASLEPLADTYVAFWGAWAAFHENTRLWQGG